MRRIAGAGAATRASPILTILTGQYYSGNANTIQCVVPVPGRLARWKGPFEILRNRQVEQGARSYAGVKGVIVAEPTRERVLAVVVGVRCTLARSRCGSKAVDDRQSALGFGPRRSRPEEGIQLSKGRGMQ